MHQFTFESKETENNYSLLQKKKNNYKTKKSKDS